jgi:hypothetical protein
MHRRLSGLDAVNFPEATERGPQTDEYLVRTVSGYISARDEEGMPGMETIVGSPTSTVIGRQDVEKGAEEVKLVTWKVSRSIQVHELAIEIGINPACTD